MDYLPWHAHITALTVAPHCRRLGHARKLSEYLERVGDNEDAWFVDLYVRCDNTNAIKLYEGMGSVDLLRSRHGSNDVFSAKIANS